MCTLKEQSDMYFNLANYDPLTGIANRQNILNEISKTINDCNSIELIIFMFDIDKFKSINDIYGHTIGDEALKDVANRVKSCLRGDDLIGRFGGDEFIIFIKDNQTKVLAKSLIKRITNILDAPFKIGFDSEVKIDISIGVSMFPTDAQDIESLLEQADQAMYKAKKITGTSYEFYRDM